MKKLSCSLILFAILGTALAAQTINVTQPAANASWTAGSTRMITWTKNGAMDSNVMIRLRNSGGVVLTICENTANNAGQFSWNIPATVAPGQYYIRVKTLSGNTFGDSGAFAITPPLPPPPFPTLAVTAPNGSEMWSLGEKRSITWTSSAAGGKVRLILCRADGSEIGNIALNVPVTDHAYDWTVGQYIGGTAGIAYYKIKIQFSGIPVEDASDAGFLIGEREEYEMTNPRPGSTWSAGDTHAVMWQWKSGMHYRGNATVKIALIEAYSEGEVKTIAAQVPEGSGSFNWTLPNDIPLQYYRVRIKRNGTDNILATSEIITVQPKITVTAPAAGAVWEKTKTYTIHWTIQGANEPYARYIWLMDRFQKNRLHIITADAPASGSYTWVVPSYSFPTDQVRIQVRVKGASDALFGTGSSAAFSISDPK